MVTEKKVTTKAKSEKHVYEKINFKTGDLFVDLNGEGTTGLITKVLKTVLHVNWGEDLKSSSFSKWNAHQRIYIKKDLKFFPTNKKVEDKN